jgi:hypothetical protein
MSTCLKELLGGETTRPRVIDEAERVLDEEVCGKSGLTGMAIKAAYRVVQSVKPGFVREVIDALLDDFLDAMDPLYQEALREGRQPGQYLEAHATRTADALLAVTDRRKDKAQRVAIRKAYEKLRPIAHKQVVAAVPRLARMVDRLAPSA